MSWDFPDDLNEAAWVLIANAWNGNWDEAPFDWQEAAARWRDAYHQTLEEQPEPKQRLPVPPSPPGVDPAPDPGSKPPRSGFERTRPVNPNRDGSGGGCLSDG